MSLLESLRKRTCSALSLMEEAKQAAIIDTYNECINKMSKAADNGEYQLTSVIYNQGIRNAVFEKLTADGLTVEVKDGALLISWR